MADKIRISEAEKRAKRLDVVATHEKDPAIKFTHQTMLCPKCDQPGTQFPNGEWGCEVGGCVMNDPMLSHKASEWNWMSITGRLYVP